MNLKILLKCIINYFKYKLKNRLYSFKRLNALDLKAHLKSHTIFVLGSSKSINELTEKQWEIISKNSSIGFNGSVFHKFQSDVYVSYISPNENDELENYMLRALVKWINIEKTLIIYKNISTSSKSGLSSLQKESVNNKMNIKTIFDLPLLGANTGDLIKSIIFYSNVKILNRNNFIFSFRSTLVTALSLAAEREAKEVILLGCELTDSCYFWEDLDNRTFDSVNIDQETAEAIKRFSPATNENGIHNTANPLISELTIIEILKVLINQYEKMYNMNIYIFPKNKNLYFIKEYSWFSNS